MKALLLHCKNYRITVGDLANRPNGVEPELIKNKTHEAQDCVLALVTVEKEDSDEVTSKLAAELEKMASDVGRKDIVILPFAHLSNNLAESATAIGILDGVGENLINKGYNAIRNHFGSHKEFMFDVYGHPGNARFREF